MIFAVLTPGNEPTEALRSELMDRVASAIGKPLNPANSSFATDLPRTRNAKLLRRLIRSAYLGETIGDTTSLSTRAGLTRSERPTSRCKADRVSLRRLRVVIVLPELLFCPQISLAFITTPDAFEHADVVFLTERPSAGLGDSAIFHVVSQRFEQVTDV